MSPLLPLRLAFRELRGGLRGFYVLIACIALGVAAIAGIGSVAESLSGGLAREGRVILGGDLSFSLSHREANAQERAFLDRNGAVSGIATMRAMARSVTPAGDDKSVLVEIKAVDGRYPLYGALVLEPQIPLADALAEKDGAFGAVADPALLARLDIPAGARVNVGNATFEIRAAITGEPDKLAGGLGFGPRLIVSQAALHATGLIQPGSLVRWHYRLRLPQGNSSDKAAATLAAQAATALPDAGWDIRTRSNASPQLERNVERFTQFLTLVGLTALLVGGVGVANAVKSHLDRKRTTIAAMRSLGATGARVFAIYLTQTLAIAAFGAGLGIAIGGALPFILSWAFGAVLPLPIEPALQSGQLALALAYGLATALVFSVWPLGRVHDIPASALFRDEVEPERRWPRFRYLAGAAILAGALAAFAILTSYDRKIAAIFVASAVAIFVLLRLIALGLMALARRVPHLHSATWRLAIANIHRPGAITPTVVLSLGLGIALLVTVVEVDGNLRRQFAAALPERAPSFFFLDIQSADAARFETLLHARAPDAKIERVPMLRGRIVSANNVRAENIKPSPNAAWALQSDRGVTYATEIPAGSRVIEGQWWPADYQGPPLLSMEKKVAEGLGLKIGDPVTVNVLGRNITATIANFRSVDWQSLGINFVLVYSPNVFRGAPHTEIATLTFANGAKPADENALLKAAAVDFPAVTALRVKDALDAFAAILANLVLAVRGASVLTIVAAMLVLAGALAASHRNRVYDAVILKTLGATRARLIAAYGIEYLLLGAATALFGVLAGSLAAAMVMTQVMTLPFTWLFWPALASAAGAIAVTLVFGLVGTFGALSQKPAPVLRNL